MLEIPDVGDERMQTKAFKPEMGLSTPAEDELDESIDLITREKLLDAARRAIKAVYPGNNLNEMERQWAVLSLIKSGASRMGGLDFYDDLFFKVLRSSEVSDSIKIAVMQVVETARMNGQSAPPRVMEEIEQIAGNSAFNHAVTGHMGKAFLIAKKKLLTGMPDKLEVKAREALRNVS